MICNKELQLLPTKESHYPNILIRLIIRTPNCRVTRPDVLMDYKVNIKINNLNYCPDISEV